MIVSSSPLYFRGAADYAAFSEASPFLHAAPRYAELIVTPEFSSPFSSPLFLRHDAEFLRCFRFRQPRQFSLPEFRRAIYFAIFFISFSPS